MDNTVRSCPRSNISNHGRECSGERRSGYAEIRDRTMGEAIAFTPWRGDVGRVTDDDGELSDRQVRRFLLQTRTLRYPARPYSNFPTKNVPCDRRALPLAGSSRGDAKKSNAEGRTSPYREPAADERVHLYAGMPLRSAFPPHTWDRLPRSGVTVIHVGFLLTDVRRGIYSSRAA